MLCTFRNEVEVIDVDLLAKEDMSDDVGLCRSATNPSENDISDFVQELQEANERLLCVEPGDNKNASLKRFHQLERVSPTVVAKFFTYPVGPQV